MDQVTIHLQFKLIIAYFMQSEQFLEFKNQEAETK